MKRIIMGIITQSDVPTVEGEKAPPPIVTYFRVEIEGGVAKIVVNGLSDQDNVADELAPLHEVDLIVFRQESSDE